MPKTYEAQIIYKPHEPWMDKARPDGCADVLMVRGIREFDEHNFDYHFDRKYHSESQFNPVTWLDSEIVLGVHQAMRDRAGIIDGCHGALYDKHQVSDIFKEGDCIHVVGRDIDVKFYAYSFHIVTEDEWNKIQMMEGEK